VDVYTLLDTRAWFMVICCGVALVLGLYAVVVMLMARVAPRRGHFVHAHSHAIWTPEPHRPVPGKAGLFSTPENRRW
jgi:hypothetical protein